MLTTISTTTNTWVAFKNMTYVVAFVSSVEYLGFKPESLTIFTVLMLIDVFTGVMSSYMREGGRSVRSSTLKKGIASKILLLTLLFSIGLAGRGTGYDLSAFVQASVTVLILGELFSIIGNIHSSRTGQPKVEFDAVEWILRRFRIIIDNVIK